MKKAQLNTMITTATARAPNMVPLPVGCWARASAVAVAVVSDG
jgi:hypothetical protein